MWLPRSRGQWNTAACLRAVPSATDTSSRHQRAFIHRRSETLTPEIWHSIDCKKIKICQWSAAKLRLVGFLNLINEIFRRTKKKKRKILSADDVETARSAVDLATKLTLEKCPRPFVCTFLSVTLCQ